MRIKFLQKMTHAFFLENYVSCRENWWDEVIGFHIAGLTLRKINYRFTRVYLVRSQYTSDSFAQSADSGAEYRENIFLLDLRAISRELIFKNVTAGTVGPQRKDPSDIIRDRDCLVNYSADE